MIQQGTPLELSVRDLAAIARIAQDMATATTFTAHEVRLILANPSQYGTVGHITITAYQQFLQTEFKAVAFP